MDLNQWLAAVSADLDVSDITLGDDARHTLLDLARDSAHEVERVAAPLTTFLVGVAVGRGQPLGAAAAKATALALGHQGPGDGSDDGADRPS